MKGDEAGMSASSLSFLDAGGEVGALMRNQDWNDSSLGPPCGWPQSLRTAVSLMINAKTPMFLAWGEQLAFLYNDAYLEILGVKHPAALGRRFADIWAEVWNVVRPMVDQALDGKAVYHKNMAFTILRRGYEEQAWFTFSYSPIRGEGDTVAGMFCSLVETTAEVREEQRAASELQQLQLLLQQSPSMMAVVHGADHVYQLANDAYLRMMNRKDLIGRRVRDVLPELEAQGFVALLDQVYATGEPYIGKAVPMSIQSADGSRAEEHFIDFIYQPIKDAQGRVTSILGEGIDVTDNVNATAALRKSEERVRLATDATGLGVWVWDVSSDTALWENEQPYRIFGLDRSVPPLSAEEVVDEFLFEDDVEAFRNATKTVYEGGEGFHFQGRIRRRNDKALRWIELTGRVFASPDNKRLEILGTVADITDRKLAEQHEQWLVSEALATAEANAKFQTFFEQGANFAAVMSLDGTVIDANRLSLEGCGFSRNEVIGKKFWECGWWSRSPALKEMIRKGSMQAAAGAVYRTETDYFNADGSRRVVDLILAPVKDTSGNVLFIAPTGTDITERKQAEEALRQADRRKDEFLAMLAHELRNPLAPISAAAELMDMVQLDEGRLKLTSQVITRQVRHMTGLIDDLLDVSRVTRGLIQLDMTDLDVKRIVADAVEQVRPLIETQRHHLSMEMAPESAHVLGDPKRLVQILTNLLNNAAKYTQQGGRIHLRMEVRDRQVMISILDNGIGIAPELQARVFELFAQAERSSDRSQGGLGLGLALVKSLVELHGGKVECFSEGVGCGSRFTVMLPRTKARHIEPERHQNSRQLPRAETPMKVLVVDDNADAARMLALFLEASGHVVLVEHSSRRALECALSERPDACVLDIGLPGMDGNELARRLRAHAETAGALLVAVSGYGQETDRQKAYAAGFDHHFIKPVDAEKLNALLAEAGRPRQEI